METANVLQKINSSTVAMDKWFNGICQWNTTQQKKGTIDVGNNLD